MILNLVKFDFYWIYHFTSRLLALIPVLLIDRVIEEPVLDLRQCQNFGWSFP
jgi:hypothetical protein